MMLRALGNGLGNIGEPLDYTEPNREYAERDEAGVQVPVFQVTGDEASA